MSMSSVSELKASFQASAERLLNSSTFSVATVSSGCRVVPGGVSRVDVENKAVYHWAGKYIEARIYLVDSKADYYHAEIKLLDSTKIISGGSVAELRNTAIWIDKCLGRFLDDGAICILDEGIPF